MLMLLNTNSAQAYKLLNEIGVGEI